MLLKRKGFDQSELASDIVRIHFHMICTHPIRHNLDGNTMSLLLRCFSSFFKAKNKQQFNHWTVHELSVNYHKTAAFYFFQFPLKNERDDRLKRTFVSVGMICLVWMFQNFPRTNSNEKDGSKRLLQHK